MIKILIAVDSLLIKAGFKAHINKIMPKARIEETHNGEAALKKVNDNEYEVIILGINTGSADSFQLIKNILTTKSNSKILIKY